jgi:hypothetical protein
VGFEYFLDGLAADLFLELLSFLAHDFEADWRWMVVRWVDGKLRVEEVVRLTI